MVKELSGADEEYDFGDTKLKERKYTVDGVKYLLREASGEVATAYQNAKLNYLKFGEKGKIDSAKGVANTEAYLVSMCLFTAADNKAVPIAIIKAWPNRIQKTLFKVAKEIGEIDADDDKTVKELESELADLEKKLADLKEGTTPAKNEQSDTTDGSGLPTGTV